MNENIEETGIFKGVENMNSQIPVEFTGTFYQSGNNYIPTYTVPDNIRTVVSQGFYSDNDSRLGLQLVTIGGERYIQDINTGIILKVSPNFIIEKSVLNAPVQSNALNNIINRGTIEESDLTKVKTIREDGKTYIEDNQSGERILADYGLLLRSQGKSRYEIANDRLKRIGTNKKVGLSGGIPIYGPAALVGSFSEQKNSNGDIIRIYEGGGSIGVPIKIAGVNIVQPISGNGMDVYTANGYNADIEPGRLHGVASGNASLFGNQYTVDTDSSNISQSKVVGISPINASVDAKVQYTEKLERVVDTTTDSSIKNNFGELSSSSKKALGMYYKDPSIGERYVHNIDSQNKNIFIIRKVDSVTHTYELLDENGGWIPLSKSDFQNNFTKYKG